MLKAVPPAFLLQLEDRSRGQQYTADGETSVLAAQRLVTKLKVQAYLWFENKQPQNVVSS